MAKYSKRYKSSHEITQKEKKNCVDARKIRGCVLLYFPHSSNQSSSDSKNE